MPGQETTGFPSDDLLTVAKPTVSYDSLKTNEYINSGELLHEGDHLYHMGDSLDCFYLVKSGAIRTYKVTMSGDQKIMEFHLTGDILGFDALADGAARCSAQAIGTVSVISVPFSTLLKPSQINDTLQRDILTRLSALSHREQDLLLQISQSTAQQRLVWFLLRLSKHFDALGFSARRFTIPMSRADIANYLGLAVETVSRELSKLCKSEYLNVHNREVEVTDLCNLAELVDITMECAAVKGSLH